MCGRAKFSAMQTADYPAHLQQRPVYRQCATRISVVILGSWIEVNRDLLRFVHDGILRDHRMHLGEKGIAVSVGYHMLRN